MTAKTQLMGILNITPDSFSDGGEYFGNPQKAVEKTQQMIREDADIIDIGGESYRPGATPVDSQEELKRIIPVLQAIRKHFGNKITLSIDTFKSDVAKEALQNGADIINSMGGFLFDKALAKVVAKSGCQLIIYHIKGVPQTMQKGEIRYKNVIKEIEAFFEDQIAYGLSQGGKKEQFILDPGIGFGKNIEQNISIIKNLQYFQKFKLPITIGVSRKSHLGMLLQNELNLEQMPSPTERLEASLAETAVAILNGATIVRTHDVWQTKKFLTIIDALKK